MGGAGPAAALPAAEDLGSVLDRLKASSDRLAVLAEERQAEQARRDELVVLARDGNVSWSRIARAARCSISRCVAIVAGP